MPDRPVLVLPGYGDSGPEHWQSLWEAHRPELRRVEQDDWLEPERAAWVAALERAVTGCEEPPVLLAHSLGCALVAHWAAVTGLRAHGALLVCPPDVDSEDHTPPEVRSFAPMPVGKLPFPSIVVASTDDPYVTLERAEHFAASWGSRLVVLERAGHVNADSGFGFWAEGEELLDELLQDD